jgi:GH25 family lysozyme M1 (1,4-beta-N-acetylmuramidase)
LSTNQFQEAWFASAPGRATDPDGVGGFQCVDTAKDYAEHIWANTGWRDAWPGAGNAKDMLWTDADAYFDRIVNDDSDPNLIPQRGDIIIWQGNNVNPFGHIAVVLSADTSGVTVIQQDGFLQCPMFVGSLGYTNAGTGPCIGWLRPKFDDAPAPTSDPTGTIAPNQRVTGQYGVKERSSTQVLDTNVVNTYPADRLLDFKGFVHGDNVNGSDVWFVGAYAGNYFHSSAFDDSSTNGLADLTPKPDPVPQLQPYQRVVSVDTANYRDTPSTSGKIIQTFVKGDLLNFKAFVRTGVPVNGTDVWFRGMYSDGYVSASCFDDASTNGLPEEKLAAPASTARIAGSLLNVRNSPFITGDVVTQIAAGTSVTVLGYTTGDKVNNIDVWFEVDKGWIWAGGVDSQDTTGLTAIPAPTPPAAPKYTGLNGIDIASYQKGIDLTKVPGDFVIIKASEGVDWSDPELEANVASARKAGKKVGFYHYARPLVQAGNTAQAESDSFLKFVTPLLAPGDILALDWEAENQQNVGWAKEWLDRVYAATGVRPLFYASLGVLQSYDWSSVWPNYGLWLAQYPTTSDQGYGPLAAHAAYPGGWKLVIWQYTSSGTLSNWTGKLDLDIFFGTAADWTALGYTVKTPAPTPAPSPAPAPVPTPTPAPEPAPAPAPSTETPDKKTIISVLSAFFKWLTDLFVKSR